MPRAAPILLAAALVALSCVAYWPLWDNDFIDLDDNVYVTGNPHVRDGLTPANVRWAWTAFHAGYWHPLTWMSLQLDAHVFSKRDAGGEVVLSPVTFHATNWLLHTGTSLLLFGLWRRWTGSLWGSFLVALLFAVHPLHVESVAWAAERKDVLSVFLAVLTLHAYARYVDSPGPGRYLLVLLLFTLGLLAKPMLVTLPCVLLLLDYWPLRRLDHEEAGRRAGRLVRLVMEKVPLFLLAGIASMLTVIAQRDVGAVMPFEHLGIADRLANAVIAYGWYLLKTFWPVNLSIYYPHPAGDWSPAALAIAGAVLVVVSVLAAWQYRRRPWLLVGWLWFLGTLVPVIGLAQAGGQAHADRFSYLPHIGLFVAIVWLGRELAERYRWPAPVVAVPVALLVAALIYLTWNQVATWENTLTIWQRALDVDARNHRGHANLGHYYFWRNDLATARTHGEMAVRLLPGVPEYEYNLGVTLLALGELNDAVARFRACVTRMPRYADAWHNLGVARLRQGRPDLAVADLQRALDLKPESADTLASLGLALWRAGQRGQAIARFQEARRHNPAEVEALNGLGVARLHQRDFEAALALFDEAVSLQPALAKLHSNRGLALSRMGQWRQALAAQQRAVDLESLREQGLRAQGGKVPEPLIVSDLAIYLCRLAHCEHHLGMQMLANDHFRLATDRAPDWRAKFTAEARRLATSPHSDPGDQDLGDEMAKQLKLAALPATAP